VSRRRGRFSVTPRRYVASMLIDCDCCLMKNTSACADCVVSAFVALDSGDPIEVDTEERAAIEALAAAGLVPRLRLLPGRGDPPAAAVG
jgi:hypothetical protein